MVMKRAIDMLSITEKVVQKFYGPLNIIIEVHSEEICPSDSHVSVSADGTVLFVSVSNKTLYTNMALVVLVAVHKYFLQNGSTITDKELIDDYSRRLNAMINIYSREKERLLKGGNPYGN